MSNFIVVAALLTLAALGAVAYPLLRRGVAVPAAWRAAAVLAVVVAGGAAALYPLWSTWNWSQPAPDADSPAAMVGRLARRLETQPDDLQGWLLLGKSYSVIEQFPLSARAYQRADNLAKGTNFDALMGLGEALVNAGNGAISGRAGRLFEQALELKPDAVKALFYSAFAAAERNDIPLARSRFQKLLDANPPAEVRGIIEQQMQTLDGTAKLAATDPAAQPAAAAPAEVVSVTLHVTVAPAVAAKGSAGAPLFLLARIPGGRGMPLVAKRLDAKFPQDVELLSSDSPMGGGGFKAGQELEIEARIANGGSAISRSGDPFGMVRLKAGAKARVNIEINQLKP